MTDSHGLDALAIPSVDALREFLRDRREKPPEDFQHFEEELHERLQAVERDLIAEELARYDVDAQRVEVEDKGYRRSIRCEETYTSAAGPVRVARTLYAASEGGATQCPLELRAGIVEGRWTPRAAELSAFALVHLTPGEAETLFQKLGGMKPSRSSLDRGVRKLSERWEKDRRIWEVAIRKTETIPTGAKVVAISVDGVMVPERDKPKPSEHDQNKRKVEINYHEAGCATLSLYAEQAERLRTIRWARMPQKYKRDLQVQLADEFMTVKDLGLEVVKLSDGAKDNWRLLREVSPTGTDILDFWHAGEHLSNGLGHLYGEGSVEARAECERLQTILRDDASGIDKVMGWLECKCRRRAKPLRRKVRKEIAYFRRNRSRMHYADFRARGYPIGTGVMEATCKTLVTARMKRSGMSWRRPGGQGIMSFRGLCQSDRWDRAWHFLSATYRSEVKVIDVDPGRRAVA